MKTKYLIIALMLYAALFIGCKPHTEVEDGLTYDEYINRANQYGSKGDFERAISACKKALRIRPTDGKTHYLLASLYEEAYRDSFDATEKKRLQHLFLYPEKQHSQDLTEEYKKFGLKAELKGLAIQEYRETVKYSPANWGARYYIATDYFNNKQFRKAIDEYKKVIEINPKYVNAYSLMGEAYAELGEYESAIQSLQTAIQIDPTDEESYYNLGRAYRQMNNGEKVAKIMQKLKSMRSSYYDKLRLSIFQ